jgi:hypothetical protein
VPVEGNVLELFHASVCFLIHLAPTSITNSFPGHVHGMSTETRLDYQTDLLTLAHQIVLITDCSPVDSSTTACYFSESCSCQRSESMPK